jgi:hypothetical protein
MALWNQNDLDFMRDIQNQQMIDTCTIERPTSASNGYGGYTQTWATVYTGKARFWISSGTSGTSTESRFWGDHELAMTEAFIIVPWDTDGRNQDRVTWNQTGTGITRTLYVVGSNRDDSIITATRLRVNGVRST